MNAPCRISVISPVYNVGPYLAPCLDSILAQTVQDWELILVDDGSTDGSGAVCDAYAGRDARIRVIHQPNAGPGAARNAGMDAARAPFLCFLDPDDKVDPDYLEILLSAGPVPDALVMTGIMEHYDDGRPAHASYTFPKQVSVPDITGIDRKKRIFRYASPNTKRFDTALLRREGLRFPTGISIQEDMVFYLDYLRHARQIILMPGIPYHYFHRSGSGSLMSKPRRMEEFLAAGILVTDRLIRLREACPAYPDEDYSRALTETALIDFIFALYACRDKAEYRQVRSEIRKRKRLFFKYFRHGRGLIRKWWTLCLAAAGIRPRPSGKAYSFLNTFRS